MKNESLKRISDAKNDRLGANEIITLRKHVSVSK